MKTFLHTHHTFSFVPVCAVPCIATYPSRNFWILLLLLFNEWIPPVRISECIQRYSKPYTLILGRFLSLCIVCILVFAIARYILINSHWFHPLSNFQHRTSHSIYFVFDVFSFRVERKIDCEDVFVSCYLLFPFVRRDAFYVSAISLTNLSRDTFFGPSFRFHFAIHYFFRLESNFSQFE